MEIYLVLVAATFITLIILGYTSPLNPVLYKIVDESSLALFWVRAFPAIVGSILLPLGIYNVLVHRQTEKRIYYKLKEKYDIE